MLDTQLRYPPIRKLIWWISYPLLRRINRIHNSHLGETCYLFGDGVSLKYFDLKHFSNHVALVSNALPFHNDFKHLNTAFWVNVGPEAVWWRLYPKRIRSSEPRLRQFLNAYREKFRSGTPKTILSIFSAPKTLGTDALYVFDRFPGNSPNINSLTATKEAFKGSFNALITIAVFMGFKKAYLIGMDYTHFPSRTGHWYEKGRGEPSDHPGYNKNFIATAKDAIELITVTLDGQSECLNFVTYKDLTGVEPEFRENTKLASKSLLDAFNLNFYNIY